MELQGVSWQLRTSQDGQDYVSSQDFSHWCEDLFGQVVVPHPSTGELQVCFDSGSRTPLWQYQQRHDCMLVPLSVPGRSSPMSVEVFRLRQPVSGCRVIWSRELTGHNTHFSPIHPNRDKKIKGVEGGKHKRATQKRSTPLIKGVEVHPLN